LSIFLGVVASIAVSIHYFSQDSSVITTAFLQQQGIGGYSSSNGLSSSNNLHYSHSSVKGGSIPWPGQQPAHRVTRMDGSIATSNRLFRHDDGGMLTAIYTSPSGRQSVVMVVEESLPRRSPPPPKGKWKHKGEDRRRHVKSGRIYVEDDFVRKKPQIEPPRMHFDQWTRFHPKLCPDGKSTGYDNWKTLKAAIEDANVFSAERFVRWNEFFLLTEATFTGTFDDPSLYYEQVIRFRICPGATLKARKGPIFINAENIHIECTGCSVEVGGTHLSFGPHARDVVVRGIEFRNAATSSLAFYYDGAEGSFEDCHWIDNTAMYSKVGNVADVNSTSIVNFLRCSVGNRASAGTGFTPALSIRS
jgi:hypothetical protein